MNINNIVIFCPSKITGGHEYLSVRLANALLETQPKLNVYYCDYPDGFSHAYLHSNDIKFIEYKGKNVPVKIPPYSAVVSQLNLISELERFIIDYTNSVIIFWFLHILNIKGQIYWQEHYFITEAERKKLGEALSALSEMGVVKCMSYGAYAGLIKDFYQEPKVFSWLPNITPIEKSVKKTLFERISSEEIKFCWLGRLDEEKARNIITYMNELEEVNKTQKLSLSLIGLGPAEQMLKQEAKKYNFKINFVGEKRDEDLDTFIREESEIGLASGTSAYEFSLRGKPVIMEWVLDKVYSAGERKRYMFTEEDEDYDYGSGLELRRNGEAGFVEKLNEILNDYENVAKKGYDYVMSKSAENCCNILLDNISNISKNKLSIIYDYLEIASKIIKRGKKKMIFAMRVQKIKNYLLGFKINN